MAYDDYPAVPLVDDDEEKKLKDQYPPVAPAPQEASSAYPPVPASPSLGVSAKPAVGTLDDLETRVARPQQAIQAQAPVPPAPRPQWKDFAPKQPTSTLGKFGHALEEMFTPIPAWNEARAERNYKNATAEYEAPTAEEHVKAETNELGKRGEEEGARADALEHPPEKDETPHTVETGNGVMQFNPATKRYDIPVGPPKVDAKPDQVKTPEQQFIDAETAKGRSVQQAVRDYAAATQKPDRPEKEPKGESFVDATGKVIEIKPGMTLPAGAKPLSKAGEPTADEQRRNDLATNLNENLNQLEDIVNRRPELFGPLAGRWSELKSKFGSDDPDISALSVLEHQIGMAQISAHGMRSAHGIEGAAQSIINGLHSGPNALKGAISTVRKSVGTFQQDVANAKGEGQQQSPSGSSLSVKAPNGKTYTFKDQAAADAFKKEAGIQ